MASCRCSRSVVVYSSIVKISLLHLAEPYRGMRYDPLLSFVLNPCWIHKYLIAPLFNYFIN
jgi:hypothetical protein